MTAAEIEKLKALEREATTGKWEAYAEGSVVAVLCERRAVIAWPGFDSADYGPRAGNARLIAAARNALPRLLEERERLLWALRPFAEGAQSATYRAMMYRAGAEDSLKQTIAAWDAVIFAEAPAAPAPAGKEER